MGDANPDCYLDPEAELAEMRQNVAEVLGLRSWPESCFASSSKPTLRIGELIPVASAGNVRMTCPNLHAMTPAPEAFGASSRAYSLRNREPIPVAGAANVSRTWPDLLAVTLPSGPCGASSSASTVAFPVVTPAGSTTETTTDNARDFKNDKSPSIPDGQEPRPETTEHQDEERLKSVALQQEHRLAKLRLEIEDLRASEDRLENQVCDLMEQQCAERIVWRDKKLKLKHEVSVLKAENVALDQRLNEATADHLEAMRSERRRWKSTVQVGESEKETAQETIVRLRRRLARREKELKVRDAEVSDVHMEMRCLQNGVKRLYEDSESRALWYNPRTPDDSESSHEE